MMHENQLKISFIRIVLLCLILSCFGCASKSRLTEHMEREISLYTSDADAYYELGEYYYYLSNDSKTRQKAVEAFMNSALMGNEDAQCVLGYMFYKADGVTRDIYESKSWLDIAEKNGSSLATKLKSIYFGK